MIVIGLESSVVSLADVYELAESLELEGKVVGRVCFCDDGRAGDDRLVELSWGENSSLSPLADRGAPGVRFVVSLTRSDGRLVEAPLGHQRLGLESGCGEFEVAHLLRYDCTFVLRFQAWDKLGLETTSLLGVQIANLFRNINKTCDLLVMALFWALVSGATSSTDFNGQLLTAGVSNKLARLLFYVTSSTRGFIDSPTLLRAIAVAYFLQRPVALFHTLSDGLLLECDLTGLFKVLFANLLLGRTELSDICVMALFDILVVALKNGLFLQ